MSLAKLAILAIKPKKSAKKDEDEGMEGEENQALEEALEEAFDALKDDDKKGFVEALKNALECC